MDRVKEIQKRVIDYEAALYCGVGDIESALPQARMAIERYAYTDLKHLLAEVAQLRTELERLNIQLGEYITERAHLVTEKQYYNLVQKNTELQDELERMTAERDAAVEDLKHTPGITPCYCCKHRISEEKCRFDTRTCFEWRGLEAGR